MRIDARPLRVLARESALAQLQARLVGEALLRAWPKLQIEYEFRKSLGDQNLQDPLWRMPEKGVFTEDFLKDLVQGKADLVVHSWKDLPTAERIDTVITATLPRADARDLLLIKKRSRAGMGPEKNLRILTSSPRREHNLTSFLPEALPFLFKSIEFKSIRGNVPTRLRKFIEDPESEGFVLAKAALDRLLSQDPDSALIATLYRQLQLCDFMILPLSVNPTAAAQGALACEIRRDDQRLQELLRPLHCAETFADVVQEREILSSYGGGCHQKIGVSVQSKSYGQVLFLRGMTDQHEILNEKKILNKKTSTPPPQSIEFVYPRPGFTNPNQVLRTELPPVEWQAQLAAARALWISRHNALPAQYIPSNDQIVWCAGVETWKKLAKRNIWVHGTADGLGESEETGIEILLGSRPQFVRLTHKDSQLGEERDPLALATYQLTESAFPEARKFWLEKSHFYWMSASAFLRALRQDPTLKERGFHACGPGKTFESLRAIFGSEAQARLSVNLSLESWYNEILGNKNGII